jgi:hypothetical protein
VRRSANRSCAPRTITASWPPSAETIPTQLPVRRPPTTTGGPLESFTPRRSDALANSGPRNDASGRPPDRSESPSTSRARISIELDAKFVTRNSYTSRKRPTAITGWGDGPKAMSTGNAECVCATARRAISEASETARIAAPAKRRARRSRVRGRCEFTECRFG